MLCFHLGVGTSQRPSSDIYTGPRPFSEKVTHNVGKYLYKRRHELKGYIDFHAYSQLWMSPWGYTNAYPPNYDKMVSETTNVYLPSWLSSSIVIYVYLNTVKIHQEYKKYK